MDIKSKLPCRTYAGVDKKYNKHKDCLRNDFNFRCGYCDALDDHTGGKRGFQIDHFKPKKKFPVLKDSYENLVYCCPFCNRAKWDKWIEKDGFIDPCDTRYFQNLDRNEKGKIKPLTSRGAYIYSELHLGLKRHELLWMMDRLKRVIEGLSELIELQKKEGTKKKDNLLSTYYDVTTKYFEYTKSFRKEQ